MQKVFMEEENMIEIRDLNKTFRTGDGGQDIIAINNINMRIADHQVFGLIGTNGAGKSTLMRIIMGIIRSDSGEVIVDGQISYDNPAVKKEMFFVPDELYFLPNSTPLVMEKYYAGIYEHFDTARCNKLLSDFGLDSRRKISGMSKGMKRQVALIMGICSGTRFLLLDETFDGLDPVMRQAVKSIFAGDMQTRDFTPVMTSHNLRELEDICDHIGLLHKGGVLLSEDLDNMKLELQKVQCVFRNAEDADRPVNEKKVLSRTSQGRVYTYTIRGKREDIQDYFRGMDTVFFEVLPLTLEEIFISEAEGVGYDVKKLIIR
jgi:ABC-2 type transport system ATP-binding protein